ncbi:MAG: ATP-binding protein [Sulfolobaceae archaeon]
MLFDTEPKNSLEELFDREDEVRRLKDGLQNERMILVLGVRRIGKSSLVLSTLNSLRKDYVFIDVRKIFDSVSKKVFLDRLYEEIHSSIIRMSKKEYIKNIFEKFEVSLDYPVKVRLRSDQIKESIYKIFEALNEIGLKRGKVPVVFDEAQYLRYSTLGLRPFLAHVYDYMKGIILIFTGSEVGLLHDFLGMDDPKSELYGRYYYSIELRPFNEEKSREFLKKGFRELNVNVSERTIEEAVKELDGIVGWLVYFGKLYLEKKDDAIKEVKEIGSRLVKEELREAFSRSAYYLYIMKSIAVMGRARWKNIVDYVTAVSGKRVSNTTISRDLKNLIKMGFVEKEGEEYRLTDPIIRYTVLEEF